MNTMIKPLLDGLYLLLYIYIWFCFLTQMLPQRYKKSTTFFVFVLFALLYGQANMIFVIAGTPIGNALYHCIGYILLCSLLFREDLVKISFLVVLFYCGYEELFYLLIPLLQFELLYTILPFVWLLLFSLAVRWLGRKFQNLRYGLPRGLSAYLLVVTLFVYVTTVTITELSMMVNDYYTLPLPLGLFYNLFAVCGTFVMVFAVVTIDKQIARRLSQQGMEIQLAGFKEKEESWHRLTDFRHDIKNHMICLNNLLRNEKNDQAVIYLDKLTDMVTQMNKGISTGNEYSDAIINEKSGIMTSKNITFTEDICLPPECTLEPVELSCIFGNLLDNAIHACEQIPPSQRWIHANVFVRQSQLVIIIENSMSGNENQQKGNTALTEGIGLCNVRRVIEKHGGTMELSKDKIFSFCAMLPLD